MQLGNSATLVDIKSDMYFLGKFNASTFVQNDLNRIINKYYKQVQDVLRGVNEDFFLVAATTTIPLNTASNPTLASFTFPTDMEKMKSLWMAMNPASSTAPLYSEYSRVQMIDANQITDPSYAFSNPVAVMFGTYFMLYPFATNATIFPVTNGVKMYYIQLQSDLANDTDVPNIFADYHDAITWGSLIEVGTRLGKPDLVKQATGMYDRRVKDTKEYASQRILDIEQGYVEGQAPQINWNFPFGRNGI